MQVFYAPDILNRLTLPAEESAHAVRVLRLRKGDRLHILDGAGSLFEARLLDENRDSAAVEIIKHWQEYERRPYLLHLAVAPTKNTDRFEYFIEKAVEIGVDSIIPILCEHSEKIKLRHDRLERIIISAMKQSYNAFKPVLHELTPFSDALKLAGGAKSIAHCAPGEKKHIREVVSGEKEISLFIGPEGDFSEEEIGEALACGFTAITLGQSRLRTETAGVVACYAVNMICGA